MVESSCLPLPSPYKPIGVGSFDPNLNLAETLEVANIRLILITLATTFTKEVLFVC
jgi:hypothetical protein